MNETKISTPIKGAIGEFYVASFLSALNLVVALPRGGVPSSDLLVTTPGGNKTISLQVKTALPFNFTKSKRDGHYWSWDVSIKVKENTSKSHWYAFVNLNDWPEGDKQPDVFFVSAKNVADVVTEWNDKPSTRLFFIIKENEKERYKGMEGFEKIKFELT